MSIEELEVKFAADDMVGALARFLRMLGYDTFYHPHVDDQELIDISLRDKRNILTRDTRLIERKLVRKYILIESDNPEQQLMQVFEQLDLDPERDCMLTRCLECNHPLKKVNKADIRGEVWPYVYDHHDDFKRCNSCGRIYWQGDHVRAMLKRFERMGIFRD